ncbi:MAG: hypothetical protein ABH849_01410 [Nanoarchaeota archaeon]
MNKTGKRNITISIFIVLFLALIVIGTNASGVLGGRGVVPDGELCVCGDGICEGYENSTNCPEDCPLPGDCCTASGGLGCNDPTCTEIVCAVDPWCCEVSWDSICADEAMIMCPVCYGDVCGDGIVSGSEECEFDEDCSENEYCDNCECFSDCEFDNEGPSIYDLLVDPIYNNGLFDITATAEDTESTVIGAEYFLGSNTVGYCGDWGTGTPLNADDGNFDEMIEDLIKENIYYDNDGSNWACAQSKDECENVGDCECFYYETDTIPPDYPHDICLDDECPPNEYLICGNDPRSLLTAKVCDQQSNIQGGEYFIDLLGGVVPAPWSGFWMEPSNPFQNGGWHCAIISALLNTTDLEDGTHDIKIRGKDIVENWGKLLQWPYNITFIIDTTPPVVDKSIDFAGDVFVECDYEVMMDEDITAGCYYVLPGTEIVLDAYDPDPQGTGEFAGEVIIEYIVWWSYDGSVWTEDQSGQSAVDEPILITLNEDSYHLIEFWATDGCGWESEHWFELDIVDSQAPVSSKDLGTPKVDCSPEDIVEYGIEDCAYITKNTLVELFCEDQDPHPVGDVTLYYQVEWKEVWGDDWAVIDDGEAETYHGFTYEGDSFHKLTWWCEDALGNVEDEQHVELDIVDTQEPKLTKEVFGGIPGYDNIHYFLNENSVITLDCEDLNPHPVDDVTLYWDLYWSYDCFGDWDLIDSGSSDGHTELTGFGSSCHKLVYSCEDALGNTAGEYEEIDAVDNDAPETTKVVGEPKVLADSECNSEEEICDYWVTTETLITLDCQDVIPHPIGGETLYWREYKVGETIPAYNVEEGGFAEVQFGEDCNHKIEWYCTDALGNSEGTLENPIVENDNVDTAAPEVEKFVIKNYGEINEQRIYASELEAEIVGVQTDETFLLCAESHDVKQTGDEGVGVKEVWAKLSTIDDPEELELTEEIEDDVYCVEYSFSECGRWHFEVRAEDLLGNVGEWENGIEIIIDDMPPVAFVLNPHAGAKYYDGKVFPVEAPGVDFGGESCCNEDCPASGVEYCEFFALDFCWECIDQEEIKNCADIFVYLEQTVGTYEKVSLGTVPYVDGECQGYLQMPEDSGMEGTVFMGIKVVDKAGNYINMLGWDGYLATNPWLSPITMDMEEKGVISAIPVEGFEGAATGLELFRVDGTIEETGITGQQFCVGSIHDDENNLVISYPAVPAMGNPAEGYECTVTGTMPDYPDWASGQYTFELAQVYNSEVMSSDSFSFYVDNTRPDMWVISPAKDETYGTTLPVSLYVEDDLPIADETVLARVHEIGWFGSDFCWGGCEDTGWIPLNNDGSGDYSVEIDFTETSITGDREYNFDAIACDSLYDAGDLAGGILPIISGNDRNGHHCRRISVHGAEVYVEEPE